jgi:hypothetical protein
MTAPENFISTTDYATLKNDATTTLSVTVAGALSIATSTIHTDTTSATLGTAGAILRGQINSSRASSTWYVANAASFTRTGTVGGVGSSYSLNVSIIRTAATTVQLIAAIYNPYASALTTQAGTETITYSINSFLSPFA